ncbi:dihydroxyacetone kinase subunit DhaL [Mycoplasma sp. AC157]
MKISYSNLTDAMKNIAKELKENEDYISTLDQTIGDGDHGFNMVRGFTEVSNIHFEQVDLSTYLTLVGRSLMSKVGGASGPLYGMAFMNSANALKGHETFTFSEFKILVSSFTKSLEMLGKVTLNEKTMYDVWKPLETYLESKETLDASEFDAIINYVYSLVENTKDLVATKGRASYLKERSSGTIDPGSYSSYIIIKNLIKGL